MSLVEALNKAHLQRQARFADAAVRHVERKRVVEAQKLAPKPLSFDHFSRYVMDAHYQRAWSIAVMGFDPHEVRACPTIEEIQKAVCDHFSISKTEMISERRTMDLVLTRQVGIYLCRELTTRSLPEIGRRFGGRDHTTALHAVRTIARKIQTDVQLLASVEMLIHKLGPGKHG